MHEARPLVSAAAESEVLGQCLTYPAAVPEVIAILKPEMFAGSAHAEIFRTIGVLFGSGAAIDVMTVGQALTAKGCLGTVGDTLAGLIQCAPTGAHIADHAGIVRELYQLRKIRECCEETIADVTQANGNTPTEVLDRAESRLLQLAALSESGEPVSLSIAAPEAMARVRERRDSGVLPGVTTGFPDLDRATGGLKPGELILVAARPSMGKTSLAQTICRHAAEKSGKSVAIFSYEQSEEELVERLLCTEARVDLAKVRTGKCTDDEMGRLKLAEERLRPLPLLIDDSPGSTVLELRARARRIAQRHPLALIAVDYLQLLGGHRENRVQEVTEISRSLKMLAKELRCPVLALSQLSRGPETRTDHRPKLSDLRDSGSLEQDADVVMFLYRPEYYLTSEKAAEQGLIGATELIIGKQRNGPRLTIPLYFEERFTRFESVERHSLRGVA